MKKPTKSQHKQAPDDLTVNKTEWKHLKNGILHEKLRAKGYNLCTPLIITGFILPLALLFYLAATQGTGQRWAVTCPKDSFNKCLNPFYSCDPLTTTWCPDQKLKQMVCTENPGFCSIPLLDIGSEYGHKKTYIEKHFFGFVIGSVGLAYLLNHLLFNSKEQRRKRRAQYEWEKNG